MNLKKSRTILFGMLHCDIYTDGKGGFYVTREQIGQALEYAHPQKAIDKIHERHKDRLDPLSVTVNLGATDGKNYDTVLYTSRGVYEICRYSHQPKANLFYDHMVDILEGLRVGYIKLSVEKESPAWKQQRQQGKDTRRRETDAIKRFIDYAKAQGSEHAERYYSNYTRLTNKIAGITDRENATTQQLNLLELFESTTAICIDLGIVERKPYKQVYSEIKTRLEAIGDLVNITPVDSTSPRRRPVRPTTPQPARV